MALREIKLMLWGMRGKMLYRHIFLCIFLKMAGFSKNIGQKVFFGGICSYARMHGKTYIDSTYLNTPNEVQFPPPVHAV